MTKKQTKPAKIQEPKDKLLPKLTLAFFRRPRKTALIWLVIVVFGALSYTTFMKREGFPSVSIPIVVVNGSYAVDDAGKVDTTLAKPLSEIALKQSGVTKVQTTSETNFFSATVQYKEDVDAETARKDLEKAVQQSGVIPETAQVKFVAPYFGVTGGSLEKIDATISVYAPNNDASLTRLTSSAEQMATELNKHKKDQIASFSVQNPFESVVNPGTGQKMDIQRSFDRYAERSDGKNTFYNSVIIGVAGVKDADAIKLDKQIHEALTAVQKQSQFKEVNATVSASLAPTVEESISELQRVLLEGLLAVLVVGSIVIAFRASVIIVLAMLTVIAATIGVLFLLGYTLNVITLFGLILGLSLIVDDTIIMTEALDAARRRKKQAKDAVEQATRKISRAMVAATLTAALSFAPLLFVGGILGGFIRAIPVTIISALLISLLVALIFIPLFARFLLLGKKQMGEGSVKEVAAGFEEKIAHFITRPMLWAKHSRKKEVGVGLVAVFIGFGFIFAGGNIAKQVTFNIFPPSKDANQVAVSMAFPEGSTIEQSEAIADQVDKRVNALIGENFVSGTYFNMATAQSGTLNINLKPYGEREITAPQIVDTLKSDFEKNPSAARVDAFQVDVGPPSAGFAVQIKADNREDAMRLGRDMASYLDGHKLTRVNGETTKIKSATLASPQQYSREDGRQVMSVNAVFDANDTTTLVDLAQKDIKKEFNAEKLASYGLKTSDITFDLGQESENQDSFKSLALAFPVLLLAIFILLAVQFRSLLQPLLIFLALPFSFFGIALGLYITDNAFSFFAMLGFFALIGLSIKNTILLTDYANQARRSGMGPIDATVEAIHERFRPLIATSITAVVSLIPLAITSPFWEGLAVVLIGGLISSTFLVITVFPYYYLGAEYLRIQSSALVRKIRGKKISAKR
jgi:multidrug efflux pump subunit AcrB